MQEDIRPLLDEIIDKHRIALSEYIERRRADVEKDFQSRLLLYQLLGFSPDESRLSDSHQDIGRSAVMYGGALVEQAARAVLRHVKDGETRSLPNTLSSSPKVFIVDSYVKSDNRAHVIRWRDPSSDGEQFRREHGKILCIVEEGMLPVRIIFSVPGEKIALRTHEKINAEYQKHGEVYAGHDAWEYLRDYTGFDLYAYLFLRAQQKAA